MARTASDLLVERLIEWGVDTVFGLPGDGINGFMDALRKAQDRIRYVHVRHEETAAMAAVGYAKFSGKLGVCFSTAAPGAIHLLNGLYDAKMDQAPVLAITGMTFHDLIGTKYLQDMNTEALFQDVCAFNQRIMGPAHIENVIDLACRTALAQRAPAHLSFPIDFQVAPAASQQRSKRNIPGHTSAAWQVPRRIPEKALLEQAAAAIEGKKRIAILVGSGARGAGAQVEALAEKLGAPVIKALLGKDVIPDDSQYTTGGVGVVGTRPSTDALKACDGFVIVGSSFPYIEFLPDPGQAVAIQIDDKPERIGLRYPVSVGLVGDSRATLEQLIPLLRRNEDRSFLEQAQRGMKEWWSLMQERGSRLDVPMKPQVVAWNIADLLEDDAILCGDSGEVTTWAARMKLRKQQRFSFSGTLCSMAAALPYAIGAQCASPRRQVVAFTGDGSLSMMMGDLVTLCAHRLPVKLVVLKNNTLGLIKYEQLVFLGNPEYGVGLAPIDFVKVAEACGARGVRIEDPRKCRDQLVDAFATDGPVVIETVVDAYEPPLPPKIKPDQAKNLALGMARGEANKKRIGLTIARNMVDEVTFEASPYGFLGRAKEKLAEVFKPDADEEEPEKKAG